MNIDKETIRKRALQLVADGGHRVGTQVASEFGLSRLVANGYMQTLIKEGLIEAEGSTRARVYRLLVLAEASYAYSREGLQEDLVWRRDFQPLVADLPENVRDIWHYGVTEMVNNAIDHSGSAKVRVGLMRNTDHGPSSSGSCTKTRKTSFSSPLCLLLGCRVGSCSSSSCSNERFIQTSKLVLF
jgi:hypothetical protein